MTLLAISIFLLIAYKVESELSPLCGTVCTCDNNEDEGYVSLDCSRVYLSIVPPVSDWPSNITSLDVSSNNITALDVELAHGTLEILDVSHNKIKSAVQYAFGGLKSLKYLNLAGNQIKNLEDDGFYGLDHLKSLNLSSNGMDHLPDNIFYNFIGLEELSLANNPLVHLDPSHFNRMIGLRWLDLSYIEAYTLEPKIFHTTGRLEILDLSGNDFQDVPTDALRSAKNLKHLILNENPIGSLNKKSFTKLTSLEVLELNHMEDLKQIEDETFSDLISLISLQLNFNHQLNSISPKAFIGLFNGTRPVLQELDLQGNRLRGLHQAMVPCALMKRFNVQQNPWICDCTFKWIKDCEIRPIYAADLKCASPSRVSGALIINMKNDDFKCEYMDTEIAVEEIHHDRVVRSISAGLGVTVLVVMSLALGFIFKWRDLRDWYRNRRKGPGSVYYVRARANPGAI